MLKNSKEHLPVAKVVSHSIRKVAKLTQDNSLIVVDRVLEGKSANAFERDSRVIGGELGTHANPNP